MEHLSAQSIIIEPVRKEAAWNIISDFAQFPQLCKNIDKITVSQKTVMEQISEWDVTFDGAPLNWIQKDILDCHNNTINFRAVSGDFDHYSGSLHVEDVLEGSIAFAFSLCYKIGIPIIEDLFGPIFKQKMQSNIDTIITGIACEVSKHKISNEERANRRYKIGVQEAILFDEKPLTTKIENISQNGLMFTYEKEITKPLYVKVCGVDCLVHSLHHEFSEKKYRLVFEKPIAEENLGHIVKELQSRHVTTLGKFRVLEKIPV